MYTDEPQAGYGRKRKKSENESEIKKGDNNNAEHGRIS
jgi:hypothetical protein